MCEPSSIRIPTNRVDDARRGSFIFCTWLVFVASLFASLVGVIAWIQEKLLTSGEQDRFLSYTQTSILMYGYMRLIMQVVTTRALKRWSSTYKKMPLAIQDDCAFMIIDAASGFFWMPVIGFVVASAFSYESRYQYFAELGPAVYICVGVYHIDRIIQLVVHFRLDRFIHHLIACAWTLLMMEWWRDVADPVIFVFGAVIEGGYKPIWYWFASARFTRRHGKNQTIEQPVDAVDKLFVSSSPDRMAFAGRMFFVYYCFYKSLAVTLMIGYLTVKETLLWWQIFTPVIAVVLLFLDVPMMKAIFQMRKLDYWKSVLNNRNDTLPSQPTPFGGSDSSASLTDLEV